MKTQNVSVQKIEEIGEGQVFTIVATEYEAVLSGAYKAGFFNDGRICLVYTDQTKEDSKFPVMEAQEILDKGMENFFSVVSYVQSKREHGWVLK